MADAGPVPDGAIPRLEDWVGRTETRHDVVSAAPLALMSATLDRDDPEPVPGSLLPPLWHWLHFLPRARQSEMGPDGHARRGGFLPPVDLPRRMWAGGRLEFPDTLRVGDAVERVSRIESVSTRQGRSGSLVFVTVRHRIASARGPAIVEDHDIVYRDHPAPGEPPPVPRPAPADESFSRTVVPDPVLLFRYSALTFNGHRIHYDRPYVTGVEGYPGLVVHGPLVATLLLDLLRRRRPEATVRRFEFRALRPVFDGHPLTLCGRLEGDTARLWSRDHEGWITMEASARLA